MHPVISLELLPGLVVDVRGQAALVEGVVAREQFLPGWAVIRPERADDDHARPSLDARRDSRRESRSYLWPHIAGADDSAVLMPSGGS